MRELERRFPDELVVIGVHSPKFPAERRSESLRAAIQRYDVHHPVFNDANLDVWTRYAVRAWPTLMFIDPAGRVIGRHEGEASADDLARVVRELVDQYDAQGLIDRSPIPGLQPMAPPAGTLAFPGKVLADSATDRLIIADSGHHRLIVARLDGSDAWVIGSGEAGLRDGPAATAAFHDPQGLALNGDSLYVADTGNHVVRRVDLAARTVKTIAGTGKLGWSYARAGAARAVDLRSPWDLVFHDGILYIAMAGMHQIWALDLDEDELRPYAGSGREAIRDHTLQRAWLAQPSGLATDGHVLYVADSETSAVRTVTFPPGDEVRTLVGIGLFDFGDVDGTGDEVRLQHPLAVAYGDGVLYVADSYNHKIKRLDPTTQRCETWLGDGEPGDTDGTGTAARFHEPGGLSLAGSRLYIADTNNHAIRVADTTTGAVTTLALTL